MKRQPEPNKIYYDASILHDPANVISPSRFASKAEKTIELIDSLVQKPGDYNICVSKFKIDTEGIPLLIPELQQPQGIEYYAGKKYLTTFGIHLKMTFCEDRNHNNVVRSKVATYLQKEFNYNTYTPKILGYEKNALGLNINNSIYLDNMDQNCYIYSFQELIDMLNNGLQRILTTACENNVIDGYLDHDEMNVDKDAVIKFEYDESETLYLCIAKKLIDGLENVFRVKDLVLKFTPNLYKYIGHGFITKFLNISNEPEYDNMWCYDIIVKDPDDDNLVSGLKYARDGEDDDYYLIPIDSNSLVNWNCLKAVVIGSDTLPVVPEYLSVAHHDGHLTHYNTDAYAKMMKDLGIKYPDPGKDIFKMKSEKILDIYYPLIESLGDTHTTIIFSTYTPTHGQNIELMEAAPISHFNLWVKWIDIYNNLHDLYLPPGCGVDLRLCFSKKTLNKEDAGVIADAILEVLPEKKKKPEKKSNGKNDGIVLEGADKYGWVHV